ncbi:hypothetical protein D1007_19267 [Hordeum vulgare]|nr:hypothetical protein D1007_19267 [Hordeum vulgare]
MAPLTGPAIASCSILLLMLVPWAQGQGQPPEASEEAWAEGPPPEPGFSFRDLCSYACLSIASVHAIRWCAISL